MMLSITGDADCWKLSCQADGCPSPAEAAPALARTPVIVATVAANRLNTSMCHRSFDEAVCPPRGAPNSLGGAPPERARRGRLSQARGGTCGDSQFLKPQFPPPRNAPRRHV